MPKTKKPKSRQPKLPKMKLLICEGDNLTVEERMKILDEVWGSWKRLGYKEEDFAEFFEGERREEGSPHPS